MHRGDSNPHRSELVRPLGLSGAEVEDLLAFLDSLTDLAFVQSPRLADPFAADDAVAVAEESATPRTRLLNGEWFTSPEEGGPLTATFVPAGDRLWDVQFDFEFQGRPHTFSGTAEGALGEGSLSGRVYNESGERAFIFSGAFFDGEFQGDHAELEYGVETPTGTLWLRP